MFQNGDKCGSVFLDRRCLQSGPCLDSAIVQRFFPVDDQVLIELNELTEPGTFFAGSERAVKAESARLDFGVVDIAVRTAIFRAE